MVLADDLDGNGRLDLVLATMNGNVYCFEAGTSSAHPLKAWPAQVQASNGFGARFARAGLYALGPLAAHREVHMAN